MAVARDTPRKRRTTPAPTRRQVSQARQQARQFESQGKAIERVANSRNRAAARRATETRDTKSSADRGRAPKHIQSLYTPEARKYIRKTTGREPVLPPREQAKRERARLQVAEANRIAPALKVLEQTTRPLHSVAAGTRAAIKGKNIPRAALRGLLNKDKSTFSDVLRDVGVPKRVAAPAGFALDVVADPTTYVTFGAGGVAKKGLTSAAKSAAKQAGTSTLRKVATRKETARAMSRKAGGGASAPSLAERAVVRRETSRAGKGLTVKFAGKEVPGVRRATAKAAEPVRKGAAKVTPGKVQEASRKAVSEVRPTIRPDKSVPLSEYREIRRAARTQRYSTAREVEKTRLKAIALKKQLGGRDRQVIDAIEAGTVKSLPADLRPVAKRLEDQFKYARRLERRSGLNVAKRKGYVPHAIREDLDKGRGIVSSGVKDPKGTFQKARTDKRTLVEIRKTEPGKYSEDAALLYANRLAEGQKTVKKADLNRRLADMGSALKKGSGPSLKQGQAVYHIKGARIREPDAQEVTRFLDKGDTGRGGRYVVLNKATVDEALKTSQMGERGAIAKGFDYTQGKWKGLATVVNPGYYLRNFAGDVQNAYIGERGTRLAGNLAHSKRALNQLRREEAALRKGTAAKAAKGGVKIGDKRVSYDKLVREAESVGAVRAGFVGRELKDLSSAQEGIRKGSIGKVRGSKPIVRAGQAIKNAEDMPRLATYISARQRGLSPERAAERAAEFHFDYADLTNTERAARRALPFYTFSARNIPLQMQAVVSRPGKFAQYQKVREEFAKAFGYEDRWEKDLPEREQRSAPFPVEFGGKRFTISLGPSGLPITDLNEFPTTKNPVKQADEWMNRAMSLLTPAAKTPVELWSNMSFFFRDQIERDEGPLVPAPRWVPTIPEKYRKDLGIIPDYVDKRTGKKQWGWPAKVGYAVSVLPGPFNFANRVLTPTEREGKGTASKVAGYVGFRAVPVDPVSTRVENLYEERSGVSKQMRALNQRGVSAENSNAEYDALREQEKALTKEIMKLRTKRGDKILPGRKAAKAFDFGTAGKVSASGKFDFSTVRSP